MAEDPERAKKDISGCMQKVFRVVSMPEKPQVNCFYDWSQLAMIDCDLKLIEPDWGTYASVY